MNSEYAGNNNGSACSFATLQTYNMTAPGQMGAPPMSRNQLKTSGTFLVPEYGAPSYVNFGGKGNCSGFLNITDAYGKNADKCNTRYRKINARQ